ncbi:MULTISPECIES: alpha/beta hydrolase fold domain-containing protein [unclassified Rathayibacter]|uniref:alpha/beta hydrolase fold domain-containing protein n=1 Tax=unclassified Rathayibacter TaxID=2609250 RepID=UPI0006F5C473|nr:MULTISPECIES: alpha/beta hydrolase fold domain-containing protein [unclassified Rathayibacter]KQQ03458.1 esterase [Rathayibacter sp. Leaf294]KQS11914.1 esterase [Rathayibacter sp. Leaf185]
MTPAVPDALVPLALRLIRANRTFVTADGARRRIRENALRPAASGPPSRLRPGVRVDVEQVGGWPVYTIRPRRPVGGVVYAHGGGWVTEIAPQHWRLAARIADEASVVVTLPIYPLVPFGTALEARDGVLGLVRRSIERHGTTSLAGDSAGGQIALSTALALRDEGVVLPGTVLISPALDLTWSNPRIPLVQPTDPWLGTPGGRVLADRWRGALELTDPVVSPLFGDLAGLGPLTVFTGTRDVLNPDAHVLAAKAAEAGVALTLHEAVGQLHVYPLLPTRAGRAAQQDVVAALRPHNEG